LIKAAVSPQFWQPLRSRRQHQPMPGACQAQAGGRSGVSAERRNCARNFRWRLSTESRYAEIGWPCLGGRLQRPGQRWFGLDERGDGIKRKVAKTPRRRNDNSPAIHGWVRRQSNGKVPRGTAENLFRPCRDFGRLGASSPSHKWLGYCQRSASCPNSQRVE